MNNEQKLTPKVARMAKKVGSKSEWRRYKKFEQENEKLRKEVSKLRKQAKTKFIDELEQKAYRVDNGQPDILSTCENCGNNNVHFISIERKDGHFEIRICKLCDHKSEMKKI